MHRVAWRTGVCTDNKLEQVPARSESECVNLNINCLVLCIACTFPLQPFNAQLMQKLTGRAGNIAKSAFSAGYAGVEGVG